eukprot:722266-Pleurochrysis_carterae.AAC.1
MAAAVACTSAAAAACEDAAVEATMLSALRRRNTNLRPSCVLSRACEDLLNRHAALQACPEIIDLSFVCRRGLLRWLFSVRPNRVAAL